MYNLIYVLSNNLSQTQILPHFLLMFLEIVLHWKWILLHIILMGTILFYNDALNISTFSEFIMKFRQLVDEMYLPSFLKPCRFPIDLLSNVCHQSEEKEYQLPGFVSLYDQEFPFLYGHSHDNITNTDNEYIDSKPITDMSCAEQT